MTARPITLGTLAALVILLTACATQQPPRVFSNYILAFVEEGSQQIRIRYTKTRYTEWYQGGDSSGAHLNDTAPGGIGLASDDALRTVLGTLKQQTILLRLGLGPTFSQEPSHTIDGARSAPSIAHISGHEWMVAFLNPADRVSLRRYVPGESPAVSADMAPGTGNNNAFGRPVIAYMKEKKALLLVWPAGGGFDSL